eukprot:CAMPEP_0203843224 /NCGR_PEP_ID=MMETSP0359-20131031/2480_1 /ASSEMBLY_ACC=CAM_ASM_000338 /TAXON_ID=268821 /ORGANISM="Scrippsiella Hangoei, Strain SHTV-5" /LENGTH=74 /DNA_ID=CAMNT_0050757975 /DNA_START=244 /DNA_END=465 /DNA_ORIENTATION=+
MSERLSGGALSRPQLCRGASSTSKFCSHRAHYRAVDGHVARHGQTYERSNQDRKKALGCERCPRSEHLSIQQLQ